MSTERVTGNDPHGLRVSTAMGYKQPELSDSSPRSFVRRFSGGAIGFVLALALMVAYIQLSKPQPFNPANADPRAVWYGVERAEQFLVGKDGLVNLPAGPKRDTAQAQYRAWLDSLMVEIRSGRNQ